MSATVCAERYVLEERLRGGPDESVWRGRSAAGPVLVSVGLPTALDRAALAARLALEHAGVTPLLDVGDLDGDDHVAVVEALPAGEPVTGRTERAAALAAEVADVLARVHAAGDAVGGLRPDAVWARAGRLTALAPRAGLLWSLRARVDAGVLSGDETVFASPERITFGGASAADDVFALAMTLAVWATGEHPFLGATHDEQVMAIAAGRRRPFSGDPRLGALIDAALADRDLAALAAGLR